MKHKNMTASQENVYCTSDCRRSFFSLGLKVSCCCHVGQHDEHLHMAMQVLQSVAGQDQKSLALVNCSRFRASYDFRVISLITTCFPHFHFSCSCQLHLFAHWSSSSQARFLVSCELQSKRVQRLLRFQAGPTTTSDFSNIL